MQNVVTVILAAGKSSRIKSSKSKIFHEIAGQPLIQFVYNIAKKISKNDVFFVCNNNNISLITKSFLKAKIVIQKKPNGTADAINCTKKILPKNKDILILYGDVPLIKSSSIRNLIRTYKKTKSIGSVLTFKSKSPKGYGRVQTIGNKVIKITEEIQASNEEKKNNLCNSGIMICNQKFLFQNIKKINNRNIKKEKYITDLFEIAHKMKKPFSHCLCSEEELQGVNNREQLIRLDSIMQNNLINFFINRRVTIFQPETVRLSFDTVIGKDCIIEPFVVLNKGVIIKDNVKIKSHSVLEGCIINKNSSIGPSARIRPHTIVGENNKIGNFVEIKNSKINDNSSISHLSYIGDSYLGKNVNIGAGTITCNYDGKRKNKTIIKDNVFVGSNTSIIAPLTIGKNSKIGAGSVISKNVPSNTLAIERTEQKNFKKRYKTKGKLEL